MSWNKKDIERLTLETRMKKLISAAMLKMDATELLDLMYEKCCDKDERDELKEKMIDMCAFEGCIVIKPESLQQKMRIEEFMGEQIFPAYNEQKAHLLLY